MLRSTISSWREYLTPIQHESKYKEKGTITPEEFVKAGDYLQNMFPTWKWSGDDFEIDSADLNAKDFLPLGKQFLVTRKVVCDKRVDVPSEDYDLAEDQIKLGYASGGENDGEMDTEEGWVVENVKDLHKSKLAADKDGLETIATNTAQTEQDEEIMEEILEEEYDDEGEDISERFENLALNNKKKLLNKRYYDLYITYSTSYRVPKIYLVGYNGDGTPLQPKEMLDDITKDYRSKTATIENLPVFKNKITSVSIHPCKHSNVMRMLMNKKLEILNKKDPSGSKEDLDREETGTEETEDEEEEEHGIRVDQYLIVFLKFISSVVPTIQYDFTMEGL